MPSYKAFDIDGRLFGKLKIRESSYTTITRTNDAVIAPFAQREMVDRFMQGIDSGYQAFLDELFQSFVGQLPELITKILGGRKRKALKDDVAALIRKHLDELREAARVHRQQRYVLPVLRAVSSLPKDELASLAEALLKFTSLKRRMSTDLESVGEPIDVAVISKGDGFVWIRRKHYFSPELNPRFMQTYVARYGDVATDVTQSTE